MRPFRISLHWCGRAGCALGLSLLAGCVDSVSPILTDAQPVLGREARLHFYSLRDGKAHDFEQVVFRWSGGRYLPTGRNHTGIDSFTLHPFDNDDWIAQSAHASRGHTTFEYAFVHKLADGARLVTAIDEDDADEATRARLCENRPQSACRISTREQLMTFARATAAKPHAGGGLVIEVAGR